MKIISEILISKSQFRDLVLDTIATSYLGGFQFANLCETVAFNAVKRGYVENPYGINDTTFIFDMSIKDKEKLRVLVNDLMKEDILKIGNAYGKAWPYLGLTDSYNNLPR